MQTLLNPAIILLFTLFVTEIRCEPRTSAPETSDLCPKVAGEVYRYHNKTQQCYKVGSKGPCGELMIFYADPTDADAGDCDCDSNFRCHRPLIYWAPENRCYLAFDQGPCDTQEWLVFSYRSTPTCKPNPCSANNETTEFEDEDEPGIDDYWIEAKGGDCVKTNTQGFCTYPNEVVAINGFSKNVKPHCAVVETTCIPPTVPSLFCAPGQKWAVDGMCDLKCKKSKSKSKSSKRYHNHRRYQSYGRRAHHHRHNSYPHHHHHFNTEDNVDDSTTYLPKVSTTYLPEVSTTLFPIQTHFDEANDVSEENDSNEIEGIPEGYSPAVVPPISAILAEEGQVLANEVTENETTTITTTAQPTNRRRRLIFRRPSSSSRSNQDRASRGTDENGRKLFRLNKLY